MVGMLLMCLYDGDDGYVDCNLLRRVIVYFNNFFIVFFYLSD